MCFYTGLGSILWVLCGLYYSTSFLVLLGQVHESNAIVINLNQSSFFDVEKYSIHFCCFLTLKSCLFSKHIVIQLFHVTICSF